jgi:acyl dehydratase
MRVFTTFDEVAEAASQALGVSGWMTIDQARDAFAEATGDHQWIHVDEARVRRGDRRASRRGQDRAGRMTRRNWSLESSRLPQ